MGYFKYGIFLTGIFLMRIFWVRDILKRRIFWGCTEYMTLYPLQNSLAFSLFTLFFAHSNYSHSSSSKHLLTPYSRLSMFLYSTHIISLCTYPSYSDLKLPRNTLVLIQYRWHHWVVLHIWLIKRLQLPVSSWDQSSPFIGYLHTQLWHFLSLVLPMHIWNLTQPQ